MFVVVDSLSGIRLEPAGPFGETPMLWTIFIVFFSLWLLGVVTPSVLGGYIHVLLVLALATLLLRFVTRRNAAD
jgi:Family of unknown function (DUF5670)